MRSPREELLGFLWPNFDQSDVRGRLRAMVEAVFEEGRRAGQAEEREACARLVLAEGGIPAFLADAIRARGEGK